MSLFWTSEMQLGSSDGQGEGLSVKRQHRCLEGSVGVTTSSRPVEMFVLLTTTQFSPRIRAQPVHKEWATRSRAQKYQRRHLVCVICSGSADLRWGMTDIVSNHQRCICPNEDHGSNLACF